MLPVASFIFGLQLLLSSSFPSFVWASRRNASGLDLTWEDISIEVGSKAGPKRILTRVAGKAKAGRMLAIMGPSGCGKTSLLNAISGQLEGNNLELSGKLFLDGMKVPKGMLGDYAASAFVKQDDLFYAQMTVREVNFSRLMRPLL